MNRNKCELNDWNVTYHTFKDAELELKKEDIQLMLKVTPLINVF